MAYAAPPNFAHGDFVTAEALTILADDITDIYTRYGGVNTNLGVQSISSGAGGWGALFFVHRFRWLSYRGSGPLKLFNPLDPSGGLFTESLDSGTAWAALLDLDGISWLHYGDFYIVSGVTWAFEDRDA